MSNPLAVITGASSGIGLELAKIFAKNNYDLVIAAEDDGINTVAHQIVSTTKVEAIQADLATTEGVEKLYSKIKDREIDSICLNAGVGFGKAYQDQDIKDIFNMIDLNIRGTTYLAHLVVKQMVKRNAGRILFTASVVSTIPSPFQAVYAATKAYDLSLAEALRNELKDTNITVTALRPGATETNFFKRGDLMDTKVGVSKKDDPAEVAQDGFDALMAGKDKVIGGSFKNKVMVGSAYVMPDTVLAEQGRAQTEPGSAKKVPKKKRVN